MSWALYTIAATLLQTFRNLEQKQLNARLDAFTVSWSRFILPLPLALIIASQTFLIVDKWFVFYCLVTAFFQILGNIFLLKTFKSSNFIVGVAFYKTEVLQTMILGLLFFNHGVSFSGFIAIIISMIGVILMSGIVMYGGLKKFTQTTFYNQAALYGLSVGFCFSISAFNLRFASHLLLPLGYSHIKAALIVLMWVICFQNLFFCTVKFYQNRLFTDFKNLVSLENKSTFFRSTILSFLGSVCWFIAYGIGNVVYVKALGQIEVIMAVTVSYFILKEKLKTSEAIGIFLTVGGVIWLILFS